MSINLIITSVEQGLVYGLMALGVYLTFRVLDFPDLTVDGSFPLGAAVTAKLIIAGTNPLMATLISLSLGAVAGVFTGFLHTQLRIVGLLSGILTMTALYSVNLRIMGRSNLSLIREPTLLRFMENQGIPRLYVAIVAFLLIVIITKALLDFFLHTEMGLALRAAGYNPEMTQSLGANTNMMVIMGLGLANSLAALSGSLVAQYQGFSDVGMGIGMIIAGLASVIIGESLFKSQKIFKATLAVILGSIIYRLAVGIALSLGFSPTDLKLVTAFLVIFALAMPVMHNKKKKVNFRKWLQKGRAEL